MPFNRSLAVTLALFAIGPSVTAFAQEAGNVGLSISYPSSIGLVWQATDRVAIRPEFYLNRTSSESLSTDTILGTTRTTRAESDSWLAEFGASVLFVVHRDDNLSLYVAPCYLYATGDSTSEQENTPGVIFIDLNRGSTTMHTFSGSLGTQYRLGERFGVFGEVGLSHERTTFSQGGSELEGSFEARPRITALRSGVGVVFWF